MAYTITLTNGNVLTTISDGTVNTSSTTLTLVGKNYAGYGQFLNNDLVHLLENYANGTAPANPLRGQLWWDTAGNLKVWTGTAFKTLGSITSSASSPTGGVTGNGWWDTTNEQFNVYNGSSWILVGPAFSSNVGTSGAIVETITDSNAATHYATSIYIANERVALFSKDTAYTPNVAISGITQVKPGLNLIGSPAISGAKYWGTAQDSDTVGGISSTVLARTDVAEVFDNTVTANLGLYAGTAGNASITTSGTVVRIDNNINNANIAIRANVSGSLTNALFVDGSTGLVTVAGNATAALGIATKAYVDAQVGTGPLQRDGSNTITGTITPNANATVSFGSSSNRFANVWAVNFQGTALQADYADLAERFEADSCYVPGTVLALGGTAEVTLEDDELSENVFGVVSTRPGYMMNSSAGTNDTHPAVAVSGRVPVRVVGPVRKGDRLVSAGNGLARAGKRSEITSFNVIGRSLENKLDDAEGSILAIVKLNS